MRLENDTSHDGWSDFSARNRTPSVMQLLSKKAKMAFFDSLKTALCFAKSSFSVSKKPRRVRARRREDIEIRFLRRHVRRRKHCSPRKRANCPYFTDRSCAAAGCNPFVKKGFTFFDSLANPPYDITILRICLIFRILNLRCPFPSEQDV